MKNLLEICKALSDQNRLRALAALDSHELCLCQLTQLLELAPSTVSKHMSLLSQAGLVKSRKDGRWVYYSLIDGLSGSSAREHLVLILSESRNDPVIKSDRKRLKEILKTDPEVLCKTTVK